MPLTLDPGKGEAIALDDLIEALDASRADLTDEAALAGFAPLLARLGRNRRFLADLAIAELERRFTGQAANAYGAQVLLLRPPNGRYVLRANFWPAAGDAAVRASGGAAFFYDHAHDHNFSFLTLGYLGPGYRSDYWEADAGEERRAGDVAALRYTGRRGLGVGEVMLYRRHVDVHAQLPPERFSVSLNILASEPRQQWRTQYRFDTAERRVAETLTVAPAEVLVTVAAQCGGEAGRALAAELARRHPSPRMRRTAFAAYAAAEPDRHTLAQVCAAVAVDPWEGIAEEARLRLDRLEDAGR